MVWNSWASGNVRRCAGNSRCRSRACCGSDPFGSGLVGRRVPGWRAWQPSMVLPSRWSHMAVSRRIRVRVRALVGADSASAWAWFCRVRVISPSAVRAWERCTRCSCSQWPSVTPPAQHRRRDTHPPRHSGGSFTERVASRYEMTTLSVKLRRSWSRSVGGATRRRRSARATSGGSAPRRRSGEAVRCDGVPVDLSRRGGCRARVPRSRTRWGRKRGCRRSGRGQHSGAGGAVPGLRWRPGHSRRRQWSSITDGDMGDGRAFRR